MPRTPSDPLETACVDSDSDRILDIHVSVPWITLKSKRLAGLITDRSRMYFPNLPPWS